MTIAKTSILTATLLALGASILSIGASTPADAKLHCKNVSARWQVCGDGKPFTKFVVGVGIRFNKQNANAIKSR
jgi:hypothetical protein